MKDQSMKDRSKTEIAKPELFQSEMAGSVRTSGDRVWLAPSVARSMEPLLAGLGIELLAALDRESATIRVEPVTAEGCTGVPTGRLRIESVGGPADTHDGNVTIEFEEPGSWAAASYVVSRAFGLSPPLLTADAAMFAVIRAAARAGQVDSPILVTGETGTGKELVVRLIHAASGRAGGMFSVNCAALNGAVLTNAPGETHGVQIDETRLDELCAAPDTTLFLDQVSELAPAAQTWVLHAILQTGDGEAGEVRTRARLVSATNRPLGPMVMNGEFKRELYDRLAVLTLGVAPLRDRRADIALLATGFLRVAAPQLRFTLGALKALANYPFPGNVRELHNLVTRFAILQRDAASQLLHANDVRPELLGPSVSPSIWKSSPFRMRREMAMQALTLCGGDRAAAARKLGISVRALQQHVVSDAPAPTPRSR
jgi:DNA-binding NtrC family response regulator